MSANEALLLIGHGSIRYPDAGRALHQHADALREMNAFAQVEVALLNGQPTIGDALSRVAAPSVRVVPFFMEDGYFTRVAIPRALQLAETATAASPSHPQTVHLCPPVGIHDAMAGLIERHALAACDIAAIPSRNAAVLVVGHGSATAPGRTLALHRHTARAAATELFARVEPACLEERPFVSEALHALRAHPVVVVSFFANQGGHVRDDIPDLIAAEQAARGASGTCGPVPRFGHRRSGHRSDHRGSGLQRTNRFSNVPVRSSSQFDQPPDAGPNR